MRRRAACDHYPLHDPGVRHVDRRLHRRFVRRRGRMPRAARRADRPRPCRAAGADDRRAARRPHAPTASWSGSARAASPASASAIAAAHGLAIGWGAELAGMSSLALLAAGARSDGEVAAAVVGGHGELFVQQFDGATAEPIVRAAQPCRRPRPRQIDCAAGRRLGRRGSWSRRAAGAKRAKRWPSAANALRLARSAAQPAAQAGLCPRARRARAGGRLMATPRSTSRAHRAAARRRSRRGDGGHGRRVRRPLRRGLDPLAMRRDPADGRRVADARARRRRRRRVGFSLFRTVADEAELLLLAVLPDHHRRGIGRRLLDDFIDSAPRRGVSRVHLEVRDGNPAVDMYRRRRFRAGRPTPQLLSCAGRRAFRRDHARPRTLD